MNEPVYAIGYARVSTSKQAVGGDSLDGQATDIKEYCRQKGYTLFPQNKVFEEPFSGKFTSRPIYNEIISLIKKNPNKIKFFVIRLISRMTRGEVANYYEMKAQLKSYGVQLRDVGGIIQEEKNHFEKYGLKYEWSVESPSEMSELTEVKGSELNRRRILRQLLEAEVILVNDGYHIGNPNDGYISKRIDVDMKKRYVLEPDLERSKYFIEMFKLRAEGVYSDKEIVEKINTMGYKTKVRRKWNKLKTAVVGKNKGQPLDVKTFQKIIQRPIYCGIICEKWTNYRPVKAKWNGLVSIDIFNKANAGKVYIGKLGNNGFEILYNQKASKILDKRNTFRNDFPYKNILACPICREPLTASKSTGKRKIKYGAYHCTRGHKRYAVIQKTAEDTFSSYLTKIQFDERFLRVIENVVFKKYRMEEGSVVDKSNQMSKRVIELKEQKQLKLRAIETANSSIVKADLEKEYEELHLESQRAQEERNRLDITEDEIHDFMKYTRDLMEHPTEMLDKLENKQEQVALYSLFFEEFPTYEEIASGTPKLTFMFKVKNENKDEKSQVVRDRGVEPLTYPTSRGRSTN